MRRAILDAAAEELAEVGFAKATLASIAARGGTSIGNVYKYFANKDELFHAAIPPDVAVELRALLRRRVQALGVERDGCADCRRRIRTSWPRTSSCSSPSRIARKSSSCFVTPRGPSMPPSSTSSSRA
jgi:AcrR family transcriptional regulator